MNVLPSLLTGQLDIWTSAETEKKSGRGRSSGNGISVYGIKKLRELILELAVRGKLVPQDPNDEPAGELLCRINKELCRIIDKSSLSKMERDKSTLEPREFHFEIPELWIWCELQDITIFENGKAHEQFVTETEKFVLVNSSFVSNNGDKVKYVSERLAPLSKDDIAIVMSDVPSGRALARCFLVDDGNKYTLNQRIGVLKTVMKLSKRYLLMVLDRNKYFLYYDDGKKQTNLKKIQILSCPIPLPPLPEQHRIVAKVDELMVLCDQLETQHINAAEAHEKLVNHLLGILTQSQSADDFSANWQRIAAHFDTLFTTKASIDALKQTLLQLAVMGKLVPQDSNDEPASKLLKRIQAEKAKLVAEGKIKKDKPLPPITEEEKPFELPRGWEWVRLQSVIDVRDGTHDSPKEAEGETTSYPLVTSKDFFEGGINFDTARRISEADHSEISKRSLVEKYDILFSMIGGNIGNQVMVRDDRPFSVKNVALFKYYDRNLTFPFFIKKYMENLAVSLQSSAIGGAQPFITLGTLRNLVMALPPLSEQHRIVTKVDELMTLCDQLKSRITQTGQLQKKLADVVVEQAIAS